jgi:hypothetical protein
MQRARALIVAITHEIHEVWRDAEIFGDTLKFRFGDMPVGVDGKLPSSSIENDPSPWPLLVLRVPEDEGDVVRRALRPPAFPNIVMAVRTREKLPIFFGFGERTTVCHQEDMTGIIAHKPVRPHVEVLRIDRIVHADLILRYSHRKALFQRVGH